MLNRLAWSACFLVSLAAARAEAEPSVDDGTAGMAVPEKARFLADRGRQLQRDGKFAEALEAYKAAYVLAPSPGLLFNLAQAYRLNGDCDDAAWMYRRFLDTDPRDDLRALVNDHLSKLQACMHTGFRTQVETPAVPQPGKLRPTSTMQVTMPSQPVRDEDLRSDGASERRAGKYLMVGGGVALAVGAVFAFGAHSAASDVSDAYTGGVRNPDLHSIDDRGQRDATVATIAGITGGAALITGVVLYRLGHRDDPQRVAFVPHRDGGEVRVAWRF